MATDLWLWLVTCLVSWESGKTLTISSGWPGPQASPTGNQSAFQGPTVNDSAPGPCQMTAAGGEPDTLSQLATLYLQRFDWIVTFVEEYIRERNCPGFFACCDEKALSKSNSGNKGFFSVSVLGLSSMVRKFGKLGYTEITTGEQRETGGCILLQLPFSTYIVS